MPRLEALELRINPGGYMVNTLGDPSVAAGVNPNDGTINGSGGTVSLRSAITAADASGASSISFTSGLTGTISLTGQLPTFAKNIWIGTSVNQPVTVLGDFNFRLIQTDAGTDDEIDNLTLEQGGGDNGGGIFNAGSLKLSGCYMSLNGVDTNGGAILNAAGASLTLENTTLYNNSAKNGGAIYNAGDATIGSGSVIDYNRNVTNGGGIYNLGTLTITGAEVTNNTAQDGGGIYNNGGTVTMTGASLTNNTATGQGGGFGGGIYNGALGTVTMTSVDIEGNAASSAGGGFYLAQGRLTLTYSTLSNNTAHSGEGAGGAYSIGGNASWGNNGGNTITDPVDQVP